MTPKKPKALLTTNFNFDNQRAFYRGKVRDVYTFGNDLIAMVASDRISAFDVVLPAGIPYKGQVLNQIANYFLDATKDIVPNWKIAAPDPMVTIGHRATPYKVEMVIRGNLTGHAWRTYAAGKRILCGMPLENGLVENQYFASPIITPTTKAAMGSHDEDISREAILEQGIVSEEDYTKLETYTHALFARGREMALEKGLLLVDTKYEFGKLSDGTIVLIDEIHTPDSSRYFLSEGFEACVAAGRQPKQLSKEFVRQWLIENGFQGKAGQVIPEMSPEFIESVSERYIDLYEHITGKTFEHAVTDQLANRVATAIQTFIAKY